MAQASEILPRLKKHIAGVMLALALPLVFLTIHVIGRTLDGYRIISTELAGVVAVQSAQSVESSLAKLWDIEHGQSFADEKMVMQAALDSLNFNIQKLVYEAGFKNSTQPSELPERLRQLLESSRDIDSKLASLLQDPSGEKVRELVEQLGVVSENIGDASLLILDPEFESYFLVETLVRRIPSLAWRLARNDAMIEKISQNTTHVFGQTQEARYLTESLILLNDIHESVQTSIKKSLAYNKKSDFRSERFIASAEGVLFNFDESVKNLSFLADEYAGKELTDKSRAMLRVASKSAYLALHSVSHLSSEALTDILVARRDKLLVQELSILAGILTLLVIIAFAVWQITKNLALELAKEQASLREAELEHRLATGRMRAVLDNAPSAVVQVGEGGSIVGWSEQALRLFGLSSDEAISRPVFELAANHDGISMLRKAIAAAIFGTKSSERLELECVRKDGQKFSAELEYASYREENNLKICLFINDVTQRKASERTIVDQQANLVNASKLSAIGEMAGGIAHEINNPLAVIQGKAVKVRKLIQKGAATPENSVEELRKIENTVLRIFKIIKGLSSISRGSEADPLAPSSAAAVVQDTLELCQERFKNHSVNLSVEVVDDVQILCRPAQISQILLNLLGNAFDAVELYDEKWVQVKIQRGTTHNIEIRVIDSGKGIPRDIADKLMQPFFTTKAVGKGTGLGLSISSNIAKGHRGRLYIDDRAPNTTFVLELPEFDIGTVTDIEAA